MVKNNYLGQFIGLKIEDVYFNHEGRQVDAATSATLSSTLILNTVREATLEKVKFTR